jgi:hypothetical protein
MESLPPEILNLIMKNLNKKDLSNLRQVNQYMNQIIQHPKIKDFDDLEYEFVGYDLQDSFLILDHRSLRNPKKFLQIEINLIDFIFHSPESTSLIFDSLVEATLKNQNHREVFWFNEGYVKSSEGNFELKHLIITHKNQKIIFKFI